MHSCQIYDNKQGLCQNFKLTDTTQSFIKIDGCILLYCIVEHTLLYDIKIVRKRNGKLKWITQGRLVPSFAKIGYEEKEMKNILTRS